MAIIKDGLPDGYSPLPGAGQICPRCGNLFLEFPSLSRRDNETEICPGCGLSESLEDHGVLPVFTGKPYWVIN